MNTARRGFLKGLLSVPAIAVVPAAAQTIQKIPGDFSRAQPTSLGGELSKTQTRNPHYVTKKQLGLHDDAYPPESNIF